MNAVDYILCGLEAELELERELGVRTVEIDRTLLSANPAPASSPTPALAPALSPAPVPAPAPTPVREPARPPAPSPAAACDFVFLHDRPLSAGGVEMMAKIVTAMKRTPETAPIVFVGDRPAAKVYVVLGSGALKRWFPGLRGAPGQWLRGEGGESVLVTYSPEYILRFGVVTPAVKKIKVDMWNSLKGVMQRVG